MTFIHQLTLVEFLALDVSGKPKPDQPIDQDMGALRAAYADHWRIDTLVPIQGRDGRYALAADWFNAAFLLVRGRWKGNPPADPRESWSVAGIFSDNLLFLDRPHRGALLSAELQIFGFEVRGGRVGRLPPCTPIGLISRKCAFRVAIRRAIAAGAEISEEVLADYRDLVNEKKTRDETGLSSLQDTLPLA
ncbi:hypothetical protein [Denitrobaculum tricleocarpae]|uniref:Uncharacterized protein n=1 Tax=Denitrobaculum tricleocarpae TaxID=2591009 RepID=A0A545TUG0_9PROT|nr:hypothetical protein [Denitrobaculum tricleocarpae]TQV80854.1 hypothetical protein FKG95_11950 [Denitrobaculum tricleocarpae]